jgi:hypothetical protein
MRKRLIVISWVLAAATACGGSGSAEPGDDGGQEGADAPLDDVGATGRDVLSETPEGAADAVADAPAEAETDAEAAAQASDASLLDDAEAGLAAPDADGGTASADAEEQDAGGHDSSSDATEGSASNLDAGAGVDSAYPDAGAGVDSAYPDAPADGPGGDSSDGETPDAETPDGQTTDGQTDGQAIDATGLQDASDGGMSPPCEPVPDCPMKLWTPTSSLGGGGGTVTTCGLHLYDQTRNDILLVYQGPVAKEATLNGDFTLTVSFADYSASGGFEISVHGYDGTEFYVAAPVNGYEVASYWPAGAITPTDQTAAATATSGVATFSRVGTLLTATIDSGGAVASMTGAVSTGAFTARLGASSGTQGTFSVYVTAVDVMNSTGTFQPDAFHCGSI